MIYSKIGSFFIFFLICWTSIFCASIEVAPGITYKKLKTAKQHIMHVLLVDPEKNSIKLFMPELNAPAQTTSKMCIKQRALAAINGGFFEYACNNKLYELMIRILAYAGYKNYHVKPHFALKINTTWFAHSPQVAGAIGWKNDGLQWIIGAIKTTPNNYHAHMITITDKDDLDVTERWQSMDYILGSTPLLVSNNQIVDYTQTRTSSFYTQPFSRTAIGILPNNIWALVIIHACTIAELAHYMHDLGCTDALNLDGGSSSTMVINDIAINDIDTESTFIKSERPIANCITIHAREK